MKYILKHPIQGVIDREKFLTAVHWRNSKVITDEPEKIGGKDIGPDPFTLLVSELVSCTLATLRMYTDHKGLDIPEIRVDGNMIQKITTDGTVMHIERLIAIPGLADAELQQRLINIAENCPISKILKGKIIIDSEFNTTGTGTSPAVTDQKIK